MEEKQKKEFEQWKNTCEMYLQDKSLSSGIIYSELKRTYSKLKNLDSILKPPVLPNSSSSI